MEPRVSSRWLLILLVAISPLGGCNSWLSWVGPQSPRRGPYEARDTSPWAAAGSSVFHSRQTGAGEVRVIDLVFDVVRIDLPIDGVRQSRKIWNHVDELRAGADAVARLARNGLRVGVASSDAWPAVRAILDAAGGEVHRNSLVAQPGMPLKIKLASVGESESIFSYDPDGRLVGKTFRGGDKILNLDYAFHPKLGGCTELKLGFEIRRDRGVMTWERRDGVIRQVPDVDRHEFGDLSAVVTLTANEFLVIGLSDEGKNEYLVGARFLISGRAGKRSETLLCVTPQPYQTQGTTRRPL